MTLRSLEPYPFQLRLAAGAAHEVRRDGALEVVDRALDGGHRDAVMAGDEPGSRKRGASMQVDAPTRASTALGGDGDVERPIHRPQQTPKGRRGRVTQNRSLAKGENCGHPALMMSRRSGTEDIDALMHALQLPFANADRDRFVAEPRLFYLPPSHHPVLPSAGPGKPRIGTVTFCVHMDA